MRKIFIVLAVLMQILVLVYMAGEREHILRYGKIIYLRTAPIDPRDLFRGDYVRLNYEISNIPADSLPLGDDGKMTKGEKIYVYLKENSNGLYELDRVSKSKPRTGVYLAGRSPHEYRYRRFSQPLRLNYGIEAYFVQQGRGREIEQRLGSRNQVQIPLEMQIAVGRNGKAVIKGHRWSPLGMGLQVLRTPPANPQIQPGPASAKVALTLANASDAPLALIVLPDDCSFTLETAQSAQKEWVPVTNPCESFQPVDGDVIVLQPREEKIFEFDFSDERWFVQAENTAPVEIGTLDWSERFRLIYRPPAEDACGHLEDRDLIWHGYLPSRAFHGRGRID
ncbi:MAG: GDYXXLXY domain-containing protein [Desulfobacterales bacterium]|nr:MAG: GDYXXLXY domain-containing protein [Desulfobacterales bacterium]